MLSMSRDNDGSYRITAATGSERFQNIWCGMTIEETTLLYRYIQGASLTGQDKNDAELLVTTRECTIQQTNEN